MRRILHSKRRHRNQHWRRIHGNRRSKVAFTELGAVLAAAQMEKRTGCHFNWYQCAYCHEWHIGRVGFHQTFAKKNADGKPIAYNVYEPGELEPDTYIVHVPSYVDVNDTTLFPTHWFGTPIKYVTVTSRT